MTDPKSYFYRFTLSKSTDAFIGVCFVWLVAPNAWLWLTSFLVGISYDVSKDAMKDAFDHCKIKCNKVMHQGRGECQRRLDDLRVPLDAIKRLCHYVCLLVELICRVHS